MPEIHEELYNTFYAILTQRSDGNLKMMATDCAIQCVNEILKTIPITEDLYCDICDGYQHDKIDNTDVIENWMKIKSKLQTI